MIHLNEDEIWDSENWEFETLLTHKCDFFHIKLKTEWSIKINFIQEILIAFKFISNFIPKCTPFKWV